MQGLVDWPGRIKEMVDFVVLDEADLELVRSSAPILVDHAEELTSAVYDHFLKFPRASTFFLTEDGEVDQVRIEDRTKNKLSIWTSGQMLDVCQTAS